MSLGTNSSCCITTKPFLQQPYKFFLPFRAWESRWTLQGDLGGGHEIQAVRAEVGKHIPEETSLAPGVSAELQPTPLSWSPATGVTQPGAGDSRCLVLWLFPLELELSSQLMTAMGTLCSAGLSRAPGGKNPLQSVLLPSAIWRGRGAASRGRAPAESSTVKCQAHSFVISHEEKSTWQIQPSPEPEWQNSLLQSGFS